MENCQNVKSFGKKLLCEWLSYGVFFSEILNSFWVYPEKFNIAFLSQIFFLTYIYIGSPKQIHGVLVLIYIYLGSHRRILNQKPNEKFFTRPGKVICANSVKKQAANMYLCTRGSSPDLRKRSLFKSCFHTNHRDHGSQDEKGGEQ